MKRTSLGLFFVLALASLAGCTPDGAPPEDSDSDSADPSAASVSSERPLSGSLQIDLLQSSIDRHAAARAKMASAAEIDVDGAMSSFLAQRPEHGLSMDDTFHVKSVYVDEDGDRHARVQHYYKGLPVEGSSAIVRSDLDGKYRSAVVDSLRGGIGIDTTPTLDEKAARAVVDVRPERGEALITPKAELVIFPVKQRFVKETGLPLTADDVVVDALDLETRVVEYRLAYRIETMDRGRGEPMIGHRFFVDAHTGEVLKVKSLIEHVGHAFRTNGPANDFNVPMSTYAHTEDSPVWYEPRDSYRNFGVWDDDYGNTSGANHDGNNVWGDGLVFAGDANASLTNRQTAIADAMYSMQGTWDMFDKVWNFRGYDNDFYDGHAYVHVDTGWDNAMYNSFTGNISVGDSSGGRMEIMTSYDTVAHEYGHGMNDFNSHLGGNSEGEGLNEAFADIIGEISETYEGLNGLANNSVTIPAITASIPNWVNSGSGRNFKTGSGIRYWTSGLADLADEHQRALPMIHAFYFMVNGIQSDPCAVDGSMYVPWGATGISMDHAARIVMRAMFTKFDSNTDYAAARSQMLAAATEIYGSSSAEYKAVQNSFAAIGVGSKMAGYPGSPVSQAEAENNNNVLAANNVANGTLPAGAPLKGTLLKRTLVSGGVSSTDAYDWFSIGIPSGKHLRACMFPWNDADLYVYDGFDTLIDSSTAGGTSQEEILASAPADGLTHPYSIRVTHFTTALGQIPFYQMYVDTY